MLFGVLDEIPDITRSSGGKDLYMGSPVLIIGKVSGFIGNVPGPPGGSRGPPSGATGPGGLHGPRVERDQPQSGLVRLPPLPKAQLGGERRGRRTNMGLKAHLD